MNTVQIGNHSKIVARREDQPRIRAFYRDVLGGTITKSTDDVDFIRLGDDFYLAVLYGHATSSDEVLRTSIWLELSATDPAALSKSILAFGVHRILFSEGYHGVEESFIGYMSPCSRFRLCAERGTPSHRASDPSDLNAR